MIELGKKNEISGAELLRELALYKRPTEMPELRDDERVVAGYDQGLGERMIVCQNLADMQKLHDAKEGGGALRLKWYVGPDPGFLSVGAPSRSQIVPGFSMAQAPRPL